MTNMDIAEKYIPQEARFLVKRIPEPTGGVAIPDDTSFENLDRGEIAIAGVESKYRVGTRVVFNHYEKKVKFDGVDYLVVKDDYVMLIIRDDA